MRRYRSDFDDDRERFGRSEGLERERFRRDEPWNYNDPYSERERFRETRGRSYGQGRFGELAEYEHDEPRYGGRYGEEQGESYSHPGRRPEYRERHYGEQRAPRSRLRCREIMTADLAVATRDTTLDQIAVMMKQEDTGVIPVVDYDLDEGNGREGRGGARSYGRLVGLITDRDIVIRTIAEMKSPANTRAEEIMSTDIYAAKPNDRVVDVIRKMGDKQVRRIPVVSENNYLRGIISMADVSLETEEDWELAQALEEISQRPSFWSRLFG